MILSTIQDDGHLKIMISCDHQAFDMYCKKDFSDFTSLTRNVLTKIYTDVYETNFPFSSIRFYFIEYLPLAPQKNRGLGEVNRKA